MASRLHHTIAKLRMCVHSSGTSLAAMGGVGWWVFCSSRPSRDHLTCLCAMQEFQHSAGCEADLELLDIFQPKESGGDIKPDVSRKTRACVCERNDSCLRGTSKSCLVRSFVKQPSRGYGDLHVSCTYVTGRRLGPVACESSTSRDRCLSEMSQRRLLLPLRTFSSGTGFRSARSSSWGYMAAIAMAAVGSGAYLMQLRKHAHSEAPHSHHFEVLLSPLAHASCSCGPVTTGDQPGRLRASVQEEAGLVPPVDHHEAPALLDRVLHSFRPHHPPVSHGPEREDPRKMAELAGSHLRGRWLQVSDPHACLAACSPSCQLPEVWAVDVDEAGHAAAGRDRGFRQAAGGRSAGKQREQVAVH
eukprot:761113-Hanusia_phi.AAC.4